MTKQDLLPVILAAGLGSRISGNLDFSNYPKGLAKIEGKAVVEYQLDILSLGGVSEVLIIVGHLQECYREHLGNRYKNLTVHYAVNEEFASSGSALSLLKSRRFFEESGRSMLMLHADIFFDPQILKDALDDPRGNLLVVDEKYTVATNDEQVVFGEDAIVNKLIKGPEESIGLVGESVAINVFSAVFLGPYFKYLDKVTTQDKKLNWEQTIEGFLKTAPNLKLYYTGIGEKLWININYLEDFQFAKDKIHPSIFSA